MRFYTAKNVSVLLEFEWKVKEFVWEHQHTKNRTRFEIICKEVLDVVLQVFE